MKKSILFAIIALTTNAFSQINQPAIQIYNSRFNPIENARGRLDANQHDGNHSENNLGTAKLKMLKQGSSNYLVDSIYRWSWDINIGWKLTTKNTNRVYDASTNLISEIYQSWNGNTFGLTQYLYTYDANNNLTVQISQDWNGISWVKTYQTNIAYDANNNRISSLRQSSSNGVLKNVYQIGSTYDANNNLTSYFEQSWNGSEWVNFYNEISIYDEHNNVINFIYQNGDGSSWVNYFKFTNSYDANNNLTASLSQYWYDSTWLNDRKDTNSYDANNNQIAWLWQYWHDSAWVNFKHQTYSYDDNNNQTASLGQNWDGSAWVNYVQGTSSYDENNNLTSSTDQMWNGTAWELFIQVADTYYDANNFKSHVYKFVLDGIVYGDSTYYYSHLVVTGIPNAEKPGITVYPNPGNGKFTLSSNNAINEVEIYNIAGVRVYTDYNFTKQGSKPIDLSNLSRGIYFVKVNTGKKVISTKIVIQ